jgi:hypothetical protein
MQWNCPHCGVTLAVPYDTLGTGWSFSRCYKCGGFALIRRAEVNIIKVDKAPPGEKIILPEAGTDLTAGLLTEEAAQKLAKHTNKIKSDKPTVRPARSATPPPPPSTLLQNSNALDRMVLEKDLFHKTESAPENQGKPRRTNIPIGIAVAAITAVLSGGYLFVESQSVYEKVKTNTNETRATPVSKASILNNDSFAQRPEDAGNEEKLVADQKVSRPVISDQVQESAMAPFKPGSAVTMNPGPAMLVQTKIKRVSLHEGPGMQFPVTGTANPDIRYVVADWKDRWFKIALNSSGNLNEVGWIRNDMVQIMPSTFLGNTSPDVNPLRQ